MHSDACASDMISCYINKKTAIKLSIYQKHGLQDGEDSSIFPNSEYL